MSWLPILILPIYATVEEWHRIDSSCSSAIYGPRWACDGPARGIDAAAEAQY